MSATGGPGTWFQAFPGHYLWSFVTLQVLNAAHAGGSRLWEVHQVVSRLRDRVGDGDAWCREWSAMAERVKADGEREEARGHRMTAASAFTRAAIYHHYAERFIPPTDPRKLEPYRQVPELFARGMGMRVPGLERVEIPYEGGSLPAYYIPPAQPRARRGPAVIFLTGLDSGKEMCVLWAGLALRERNIACLCPDGPGQGESIRLRKIPHRHDTEVPVRAMVDCLVGRPDVDPARVGLMGVSLGGYLAPRAAAFERRLRATVAWGAQFDYHEVWVERWGRMQRGGTVTSSSPFHLPWVMGVETMEEALEKLKDFTLAGVAEKITCPLFILHGADDAIVPLVQAERLFRAAGSREKELRVFRVEDGGSQHCLMDNVLLAAEVVSDWWAERL